MPSLVVNGAATASDSEHGGSDVEHRRLGADGPDVSVFGLGCWSFGGGDYWGSHDQASVERIVHCALDEGVNLFDTAEVYNDGASERSLGAALGSRRDEAVIVSEVSPAHADPARLRTACEASLRRLGTEVIDVYLLHWPLTAKSVAHFTADPGIRADPPHLDEALATLRELRGSGKIRHFGVSNFGVNQLRQLGPDSGVVADELPLNLLSRAAELQIVPECLDRHIGVLGYMTLQQGLLSGRYAAPSEVPAPQAHSRHFAHWRGGRYSRHGGPGHEELVFRTVEAATRIATDVGVSLPELAIAWATHRPGVTAALVGARSVERLLQDVSAAGLGLAPATVRALDEAGEPLLRAMGPSADYYEPEADGRIE